MYASIEEAMDALQLAEDDVAGDMGEEAVEAGYQDIVASVAMLCRTGDLAVELCRRKLGWVPADVRDHFGPLGLRARR